MNTEDYFKELEEKVQVCYSVAEEARKKGLDPLDKVEIKMVRNLAERVIGLISVKYPQLGEKIVQRISELEKEYGLLDFAVAFKIAEEIAKEKFCKFKDLLEAIDAGLRVAFGYLTVGVVAAPLEGYTHFKLKKTREGKDYFCLYFSGPIGAAGRTIASTFLLIADYLRQVFGFAEYDPTEEEIKRAVMEVYDRHERVTNLQYLPSREEIEFMYSRMPIQIDGDPTENKEVSNYKDLERIETNFIRSGFCLILGEGISQKASKLIKVLGKMEKKGIDLSRWNFLKDFVELQKSIQQKKKEEESSAVYIKDLVAGRPVLGHPGREGGFRLRYGKSRMSGLSSMAMHPFTMEFLKNYIGVGTQLKYEGPGKSSAMSLCDEMEPPIIKIKNGSVIKIDSKDKAKKYKEELEEVLFLGDFLVNYGEYFNRGKHLQKPGYVEEWFSAELEKSLRKRK
jgi:DNA polymerase II large subunit